eukprot:6192951-Pleurochrysis_carterae.AAC.1
MGRRRWAGMRVLEFGGRGQLRTIRRGDEGERMEGEGAEGFGTGLRGLEATKDGHDSFSAVLHAFS